MRSDALDNRNKLLRAARDLVAESESLDITTGQIAARAGVSPATLFRHFANKDTLIDEISAARWAHMERRATRGAHEVKSLGKSSVRHVVSTLEAFTRMVSSDEGFLRATGLRVGRAPAAIRPHRDAFEPAFAALWVDAQRANLIRRNAHPRDAVDMAGAIRDPQRRTAMFHLLATGICTDAVDVERLVAETTAANRRN